MNITELFTLALSKGWKIELTSCTCGGKYAWYKPRDSGTMESVGCICHIDLEKELNGPKST